MLVSKEELLRYMNNLNLNVSQKINVEATLSSVQNDLELYCNRPLELVQVREVVEADIDGFVRLSVTPIHKIISVTQHVNGKYGTVAIGTPDIPDPIVRDQLIGENGRVIDTAPTNITGVTVRPGGLYLSMIGSGAVVEYIGGYVGIYTDAMKQAIKRVAAREVSQTSDDTVSLREGQAEEAVESDRRELGWTTNELMQFDRVRRRVVA